jgi:adenylate cyclase
MRQVDETPTELQTSELWRRLLTGEDPALRSLRRVWRHVPSSPRCKVCAAPFQGPGSIATKFVMHGRSRQNPLLCGMCFGQLRKRPGGAEIEISVLFADVRGSTSIAERTTPDEFRHRIQTFYEVGSKAIESNGGTVDKFLGDGIMALFIPVLTGEEHAHRAIAAARDLLRGIDHSDLPRHGVHVGVGIDRGAAFVGVLGLGDKLDFTALGDTVNTAARLGSAAGPGHLLMTERAWAAGGFDALPATTTALAVSGKREPVSVVDLGPAELASAA